MAFDPLQASWLGVVGSAYDIAGAAVLARGLFLMRSAQMVAQASSGFGGVSFPLMKMFSEQKYDACFGGGLLGFGFVLQALASAGDRAPFFPVATLLLALLGLCIVAYLLLRRRVVESFFLAAFDVLATMVPNLPPRDEVRRKYLP